RWNRSDESRASKLRAVEALVAVGGKDAVPEAPELYLVWFVRDPDFEVMRAAYRAMRDAVARDALRGPAEKKAFPRFPSVPDAEVSRASMHTLQERVDPWWDRYL